MSEKQSVFSCRMCGQCCQGKGGIVLSARDLARLARFLGISEESVRERHAEFSNGKWKIKSGENGFCVFFRPGAGCGVHEGKPDICRAWPFFRGNLEDPASLAMAREYCPGIDKKADFARFRSEGLEYLRANNLLAADARKEANSLIIKNL